MTLSLRALTFVMSTVTSPVPTPYSAPRRAIWAAWALATSVLVGMQPVFTQVPPTSLRSITATVCPAAVSLPGQWWTRLARTDDDRIEFLWRSCHSDDRCQRDDRESADYRDGILDKRDRQIVSAVGRHEPLASLGTAERADHGADQRRTDGSDHDPRSRIQNAPVASTAPENAPVTSRAPNCCGTCRLGVLGS